MKDRIVLIGFMASGKTTIGKYLARRLNYDFIDTDIEIERLENKSIDHIFSLKGESYFRELESRVLEESLKKDKVVISTGGGVILSQKNRLCLSKERTIYLNANVEWILTNLNKGAMVRPLIQNEVDPKEKIIKLMEHRKVYYENTSDIHIDVNHKSPKEIVDCIIVNI